MLSARSADIYFVLGAVFKTKLSIIPLITKHFFKPELERRFHYGPELFQNSSATYFTMASAASERNGHNMRQ